MWFFIHVVIKVQTILVKVAPGKYHGHIAYNSTNYALGNTIKISDGIFQKI